MPGNVLGGAGRTDLCSTGELVCFGGDFSDRGTGETGGLSLGFLTGEQWEQENRLCFLTGEQEEQEGCRLVF